MGKLKKSKKPAPDGWDEIESTLFELDQKMKDGKYLLSLSSFQ